MSLDFSRFNTGTLFLVRTPDVFPVGYANECFSDMKKLHFNFAALLETWNCMDGIVWKNNQYPRSSFWKKEERDPIEECFLAADKYDMAFLPEAGVMHEQYMLENKEGMLTSYDGNVSRYSRIGLVPTCPKALQYFINKYDALYETYGHHPSFQGFCLPCENLIDISYDKYSTELWQSIYGTKLPTPEEISSDEETEKKVIKFFEDAFIAMYEKLAKHLKKKYGLPLMHYPVDKISSNSFFQPTYVSTNDNLTLMAKIKELDMLNLQLHPPLNPNPYFFKFEAEFLMANSCGRNCMADTHFYHEFGAGRLPDTTPKRIVDNILSTLTPYGISFFCYGFMAEKLPLWKKELNPGAPVFKVYDEEHTVLARRKMVVKTMDYIEILRPLMCNTSHWADCAIYYPEKLDKDNIYSCYAMEHIFGTHELFNAAAIPLKVIDKIPQSDKEQKLIIFNNVKSFSAEESNHLKKYLSSGGHVVVIGKCCSEIEQITGISVHPSNALFVRSEDSDDYNHCFIRLPESGKHYFEENGQTILEYNDFTPAVTRLGNVLYIGMSDEIGRFGQYRDFALASWVKKYFYEQNKSCGVKFNNVYVNVADKHQFTSCDLFGNDRKCLLLIRNFGVEQNNSTLSWKLPEGMAVKKAWYDGFEFDFMQGERLPLFEHFCAVYAEKI